VIRPVLRLGLTLLSVVLALPGCETLEHRRDARAHDDSKSESEEEREAASFFKSSRISGAMSSEGRSIERSLGIQ
jgi:hypothetical protein